MLLDFDEHLHHRHIMQKAFTRSRLRGYADRMAPVIADRVATWHPGERFLVYPALKQLTLDEAIMAFMGAKLGASADGVNRAFVDTVRAGTAFVRAPAPGGRRWRGVRGRAQLEEHFTAMLPAKRTSDGDDLFAALCHAESEDGAVFGDTDVVEHMIFLLMAAHDTVTITLTTMMYELARNPAWQRRVREESVAFGPGAPGFDDLDAFPTLDLVMRESMRLVTPVPPLPRRTTRDTDVLGYLIPGGALVTVNSGLTHRLEYWSNPGGFDLERGPARLSSRRFLSRPSRGRWTQVGVHTVWRRRAQVHRHALRADRDDDGDASDPAAIPLERRPVVRHAARQHCAAQPGRRPSGPPGTHRLTALHRDGPGVRAQLMLEASEHHDLEQVDATRRLASPIRGVNATTTRTHRGSARRRMTAR